MLFTELEKHRIIINELVCYSFYEMLKKNLVMLLGDSCTGKTCLLVRYKDGAFLSNNFISTVGIDYRNKVIDIDSKKIKLQVIFFIVVQHFYQSSFSLS
uniref:Ras family protein n=1 Tax=Angiostrongylus cantonensis TaxID=6313 RepID=A0A0K0D499_ANGCA